MLRQSSRLVIAVVTSSNCIALIANLACFSACDNNTGSRTGDTDGTGDAGGGEDKSHLSAALVTFMGGRVI